MKKALSIAKLKQIATLVNADRIGKPAGLINDFPQEDVVAVFYWCQKCGLHFQWPHARGDHRKVTHKFKVIVRAEPEDWKLERD